MSDSEQGILFGLGLLAFYFLPGIVAEFRRHRNATPIFIVNLFLGWTLVVWVVALAWAFSADVRPKAGA